MISKEKKTPKFSSTRRIAFGFWLIIIVGAILLTLPISSANGEMTNIIDSLFMSTTSVCVTGLTTLVAAEHWSLFGKVVILVLIQLGGLGVIFCMVAMLKLFRIKVRLREKVLIQDSYNLETIGGIDTIVLKVCKGVFFVEFLGAVFYSFSFVPKYGFARGVWYSVFHSVSAFCNAGIDILGDNSLMSYSTDIWVNLVTMFLIIMGGIGFTVWWDVLDTAKGAIKRKKLRKQLFSRLHLHSKIAITVTLVLILLGTALIFAFEYSNTKTIGNISFGEKILASFFESVTTRTAGFASITQDSFRMHTYIIILFLMIIGGSPMGTAGGFKTTTVAMMFFCVRSVIHGKQDTEVFNRKISSRNIKLGLTVITLEFGLLAIGIIALSITDNFSPIETIFECFSAIATVGLTTGITPMLSTAGKFIIMILMFIGRVGPITMVMALGVRTEHEDNTRELAKERIIVG